MEKVSRSEFKELIALSMGANVEAAKALMNDVYSNNEDFTKESKCSSFERISNRYCNYIDDICSTLKKLTDDKAIIDEIEESCFIYKSKIEQESCHNIALTK